MTEWEKKMDDELYKMIYINADSDPFCIEDIKELIQRELKAFQDQLWNSYKGKVLHIEGIKVLDKGYSLLGDRGIENE